MLVTVYKSLCSVKFLSISVGSCASAQEPLNFPRLEKVKQMDGNTEEKRDELLRGNISRKSHSLSLSQLFPSSFILGSSWLCLTFCWSDTKLSPVLLWWGWRLWPCVAVKPGTWFTHTQTHRHTRANMYVPLCLPHQQHHINQPHSFDLPPLITKPNKRD